MYAMNECVMTEHKTTQRAKFKEAAREIEADEDEARWEERLRKIAKQSPDKSDSDH